MATRTIATSIKLDGETEFKRSLGEVNRELRNLDSEMKLTEEAFRGQANTTEALTAKGELLRKEIEQQVEKINALEKAVDESAEAFGESDKRTDDYRQSLNRAQTDLLKLNRELQDNEKYLDEAQRSADGAATSIDEFGREVGDVDVSGMNLDKLVSGLSTLKNTFIGGVIVGGVKELAGALTEVVESTEEYRRIMGTLETSSEAQGYSAEETAETYNQLYSVLGDTQAAATATANLQALGVGQENLRKMTELAIGAWATYGDSIPIDGLAEAINETIQAGTVTGSFADVLNWAGISEDEFNAKLADSVTYGDRVQLVMDTLAKEGLADTAEAWRQNNEDIVKMNEATANLESAMGDLGEFLAPFAADIKNFGAEAIVWLTDRLKEVVEWVDKTWEALSEFAKNADEKDPGSIWGSFGSERMSATRYVGSHAAGLAYVPYDNYIAQLHEGERVLTASENRALDALGVDLTSTQKGVTKQDLQNVTAAAVNAIIAAGNKNSGDLIIRVGVNDAELATALLPAFRSASKSDPEAVNDG